MYYLTKFLSLAIGLCAQLHVLETLQAQQFTQIRPGKAHNLWELKMNKHTTWKDQKSPQKVSM